MNDNLEIKNTITEAAKKLFARFGLAKTTMEDIARASNKGKSTLYYYFKNKEDVFACVITDEINGLKSAINQAVTGEGDPCLKLQLLVATRLEYLLCKTDEYTAIREDYLKNYAFIKGLLDEYSAWELATIRDIIRYGREKNVFDVLDTDAVSKVFFLAFKGLEHPWMSTFTEDELERTSSLLVKTLLQGISRV